MSQSVFTQVSHWGRNDNGNETTATYLGSQGSDQSIDTDVKFRWRFLIDEGNSKAWSNVNFRFYYSLNGGAYTLMDATTPIQITSSTNYTNGDNTTSQLTGGSGTFLTANSGMANNTDGITNSGAINQYFEMEGTFLIDSAQVANNDTINIRIYNLATALDVYTDTPVITAIKPNSGTSAITLGDTTLSASGEVEVSGSSSVTLGATTLSASGLPHIQLSDSANISAGATDATTAQLTAPTGKTTGDFQAGKMSDDTNPVTIVLVTDNYTELEFSIKGTTDSETDGVYRFRITNNGTPLDVYDLYPELTVTSSGATGNSSITLGDTTLSSSGTVDIDGTSSPTFDDVTSSSSGSVDIVGTSSPTFDDIISSSSASVEVDGTSSPTFDDVTSSSSGSVEVDGTASPTLDDITSSSTGIVEVDGASTPTLDDVTSSATGSVEVDGTSTITTGDTTLSSSGLVGVDGTLNSTLENASLSATGTVVVPTVGTANITLDATTLSSNGLVDIDGNSSSVLDDVTSSSNGVVDINGSSSINLDDVTSNASGEVSINGSSASTFGDITLSGSGVVVIDGSSTSTLDDFTLTGSGQVTFIFLEQEGFRFRYDDGTETTATWIDTQDTAITINSESKFRLRFLVDSTGGDSSDSDFNVEYRKKVSSNPDVWGDWISIE